MIISEVFLDGFRNYSRQSISFSDGVNVVSGANAQGKTNLVEAVYYLTAGKSFRPASDKDFISFDRENAVIRANISSLQREQILEAKLYRSKRRELFANGVKLKKMTELTGRLKSVMFGPGDLDMIRDGAAVRRKLMDQCLSQLRPGYLAVLMEFQRLYEHKTRILRDYREKPSLLELLDDYDLRLAQMSARLIYYRTAFSTGLSRRAAEVHSDFSNGKELLSIKYRTVGMIDSTGKRPEELLPELLQHQKQHRKAELSSGHCLSGAHKDDLEIDINGAAARKFASQGQARTAAVSIKLAERDIHFDDAGEYPVLLLDDVLSELDPMRQSFILGRIVSGQVIITCCDESAAIGVNSCNLLRIENGRLLAG